MDLDTIKMLASMCESEAELNVLSTLLKRIEPAEWFIDALLRDRRELLTEPKKVMTAEEAHERGYFIPDRRPTDPQGD